jgi:hypothetical protein
MPSPRPDWFSLCATPYVFGFNSSSCNRKKKETPPLAEKGLFPSHNHLEDVRKAGKTEYFKRAGWIQFYR